MKLNLRRHKDDEPEEILEDKSKVKYTGYSSTISVTLPKSYPHIVLPKSFTITLPLTESTGPK